MQVGKLKAAKEDLDRFVILTLAPIASAQGPGPSILSSARLLIFKDSSSPASTHGSFLCPSTNVRMYVRTYVPLSCSTSLCCCRSVQLQPKLADSYWQRHLLSLIQGNTQVHTLCTLVYVSACTLFAGLRTYVRTYTLALYVHPPQSAVAA